MKTYGEVIERYRTHREAKSLGPDGRACRNGTRGVLRRRTVHIVATRHVGKESNQLEERSHGLVSESDYLNIYDEPSCGTWQEYGRAVLETFTSAEVAEATRPGPGPVLAPGVREATTASGDPLWEGEAGMAKRTVRDIASRKTTPTAEHEALLLAGVTRLAAQALYRWGVEVPRTAPGSPYVDEAGALSLYLEEHARRAVPWEDVAPVLAELRPPLPFPERTARRTYAGKRPRQREREALAIEAAVSAAVRVLRERGAEVPEEPRAILRACGSANERNTAELL